MKPACQPCLPSANEAKDRSHRQFLFLLMSCNNQNRKSVCDQNRTGSEDGDVKQEDGFGFGIGGMAQVVDVTVRAKAADHGGTRRSSNGVAMVANWDFAVVAHPDLGALAPDVGPPRALGRGPDDGSLLGEGLLVGGVGCLA